jgi:hypothetical protein
MTITINKWLLTTILTVLASVATTIGIMYLKSSDTSKTVICTPPPTVAQVDVLEHTVAVPEIAPEPPKQPLSLPSTWPSGSERFVGLKTSFSLHNPTVNHNLPKRTPSQYSYVGAAAVDCVITSTYTQISCEQVALNLPILLPDEVFTYYCTSGVCMETGKCEQIVGADPFWYDPKFKVEDVVGLQSEYYPPYDTVCS